MTWFRRSDGVAPQQRRDLERWVRLRLHSLSADPMVAIIGAVGRLTDSGMSIDDATDTVLRILHEEVADRPIPG